MMSFFHSYSPLFELALFNTLLAFSQYVVLRAGVFSLGTAAFAAIGAYVAAIVVTTYGLPFWIGIVLAIVIGALVGAIVAELPTGAQGGLGARLLSGSYYGQTVQIWAALVVAAVLGAVLVALVGMLERKINRRMGIAA